MPTQPSRLQPPEELGGFEAEKVIPSEPTIIGADLSTIERQRNSISTDDVIQGIDQVLAETAESLGTNSAPYRALIKLKQRWLAKPKFLNFMQANNERVTLGEIVGKGFQKDTSALPEVVDAQYRMWTIVRNKLGKLDPELDEMLRLDHTLKDISTSLESDAAKGFTPTPKFITEILANIFGRNIKIADFLRNRATRDIGAIGATTGAVGSQQARESLQESR